MELSGAFLCSDGMIWPEVVVLSVRHYRTGQQWKQKSIFVDIWSESFEAAKEKPWEPGLNQPHSLFFFLLYFFPTLQIFKSWQNSKLTIHSSLVSAKQNTKKEKNKNNMEWNAWHVLESKIPPSETSIYGLVKNIWIDKLRTASRKARCLVYNTLVAILNHLLKKKVAPQTHPSRTPPAAL